MRLTVLGCSSNYFIGAPEAFLYLDSRDEFLMLGILGIVARCGVCGGNNRG